MLTYDAPANSLTVSERAEKRLKTAAKQGDISRLAAYGEMASIELLERTEFGGDLEPTASPSAMREHFRATVLEHAGVILDSQSAVNFRTGFNINLAEGEAA